MYMFWDLQAVLKEISEIRYTKESNIAVICLITGIYRELCLESVKNKYECEIQASRQHCEVVPAILHR